MVGTGAVGPTQQGWSVAVSADGAEDVVERECRHLDIIAGAKERLLDAAGLAAEIRPRMSFVSSKRIW